MMQTSSIQGWVSEALRPRPEASVIGPDRRFAAVSTRRSWSARIDLDEYAGFPATICLTGLPGDEVMVSVLVFSSHVMPTGSLSAHRAAEIVATKRFRSHGRDQAEFGRWLRATIEGRRRWMAATQSSLV